MSVVDRTCDVMDEAIVKIDELRAERDSAKQHAADLAKALSAEQRSGQKLRAAAHDVLKVQADFKTWADAGVMRGLLPYSETDLRRQSRAAFAALTAALTQAEA